MSDWREFDQNPVSHSAAHHLTTIQWLLDDQGYARVSDVARHLGITRGSVSVTLKGLRQRGLVVEDDHKHLSLSVEGLRIARGIRTKRILIQALFREVLGVPDNVAEQDACKIEHLISDQTAEAAGGFLIGLEESSSDPQLAKVLQSLRMPPAAPSTNFPGVGTQKLALRLEKKDSHGEDPSS
ncbi:MAG: metal-dependent transcriptional regulator [Planctomycetota bacterium]|nr:metal-dependent transcriptional regulator [Planctomycetota bacterium]